jgi:PAS domain S-box-containing protein
MYCLRVDLSSLRINIKNTWFLNMYELLDNNYNRKRIDELYQLILDVAEGNFDVKGTVTDKMDDIDAISSGINMLLEELKSSTVSRDYFNSIYKSIVDMVFIFDTQGNIISTNDEAQRVLQYSSEDLTGIHFSSILDKNSKSIRKLFKSLSIKKSFQSIEKILINKQGDKIFTSCSGSLLFDNKNNISGILCISRDITKLKKFEQALINKNKEMDTFLYKASHDLKGPLVTIKGLANIAAMSSDEKDTIKYLEMISQTAEKLNNTLVTLLKLAVSDNILKEKSVFDIRHAIDTVLKQIHTRVQDIPTDISIQVEENLCMCSNEIIFCTIIQNLIENSIKYRRNSEDDYVKISAKKVDDYLILEIKDNGVGISSEMHEKIFELFFRANKTQEGSGLGLYIVQSHVEKLLGSLSLQSTLGQGTTFSIKLPDLK